MPLKQQYAENVDAKRYTEYIHSSDSLFHFMDQIDFLKEILNKKVIYPRYCPENVDYLDIEMNGCKFTEVLVLQKCFCDIPLHDISKKARMRSRSLTGRENEETDEMLSHTDLYGSYGISFSKGWAEKYNLQPVQYLNPKSSYCREAGIALMKAYDAEDLDDFLVDSFLRRLAFEKPLKGWMKRGDKEVYKTFHDEREWRYVPDCSACEEARMEYLIANPKMAGDQEYVNQLNNEYMKRPGRRGLWISYEYDDIGYLIVPDNTARMELMKTIMNIPDEMFGTDVDEEGKLYQRLTLISKILVLDQIRKDW